MARQLACLGWDLLGLRRLGSGADLVFAFESDGAPNNLASKLVRGQISKDRIPQFDALSVLGLVVLCNKLVVVCEGSEAM